MIVVSETNYYSFTIFVHYIEWRQERLIWIAFLKNEKNKDCLFGTLPKDIVNHVLLFVGPRRTLHYRIVAKRVLANVCPQTFVFSTLYLLVLGLATI